MKGEEFIEHYGVRGMRWGVRRAKKDKATARTHYQKAPGKLTDAELKRRVQRMETEKRYNELNKKDVSAGRSFVTKILNNSGSTAMNTLATAGAVYIGKLAIQRAFGENTIQGMFPKKKK